MRDASGRRWPEHERKLSEAQCRVREMDVRFGRERDLLNITNALNSGLMCDEATAYDALYMLIDIQNEKSFTPTA